MTHSDCTDVTRIVHLYRRERARKRALCTLKRSPYTIEIQSSIYTEEREKEIYTEGGEEKNEGWRE